MEYNETETKLEEKQEVQTEEAIVKKVMDLKGRYEEVTKDNRQVFKEIFNTYMGKEDQNVEVPYDTKETIPKLRTEIAYIKPNIFSGEPEAELLGIGKEDENISKLYEQIINQKFRTIPQFNDKIEAWVGQGVGFGTSIIRVNWKFETKDNGDGTESIVKDEPDIEVPNILDVYYNPIIAEVKDQPCLIFRSVMPLDDVKKNPIYDYVNGDGVRTVDTLAASNPAVSTYNSSSMLATDAPNAQQKVTEGMLEIFELVDNDRLTTITNGKVLRDTENKYGFKNAVKFIFEPNIIPNRFDGLGVGHNTLNLGRMFYKMFNQASTNVKLANNGMFMHKKGAVADKRQFVSKPGGGIEVDANGPLSDNIEFIQYPDLKQGFIELLNKIDDEHKRASGANDLLQGSASNDTYGQDQLAQQNISNRFEIIKRRFKEALSEVANMILKMELQNLQSPDAEIMRIFPEFMPGPVDPLTGQETQIPYREEVYQILINERDNVKYNVRIKGETNVVRNKNLEAKRKVELFNLAQNFLTDKEKRAFLRDIAEEQGMTNIDDLVGETNPIMEQQEQMALQQGQMGMATGMPGAMGPKQDMISNSESNPTM